MQLLIQRHKEWIKIVQSFGVKDYYEDIVQDAYIKCWKLEKVNESYFKKCLYLLSMDYHKSIKMNVEIIDDIQTTDEVDNIDVSDVMLFIDSWNWFDKLFYLRYIEEKTSLRKFAIKYHYDYNMVFRTLKRCKLKLKEYGEKNK